MPIDLCSKSKTDIFLCYLSKKWSGVVYVSGVQDWLGHFPLLSEKGIMNETGPHSIEKKFFLELAKYSSGQQCDAN